MFFAQLVVRHYEETEGISYEEGTGEDCTDEMIHF